MEKRAMEDDLRRSDQHRSHGIEEEKRVDSDHAADKKETDVKIGNKRPYNENDDANPSSPKQKHLSFTKQEPVLSNMEKSDHTRTSSSSQKKEPDDQLESARAEMGEVREENQRLKMYLDRIMKDYKTLQMQFYDIVQQEAKKPIITDSSTDHQEMEEPSDDLVSLSLGRSSSDSKKDDQKNKTPNCHQGKKENGQGHEGLSLRLDCKFEASKSDAVEPLPNPSPENSSEDHHHHHQSKEEAGETWPPSKVLKTMRSGEDELLQQNTVKKTRVSVRARCDTTTMNDGCQWRKYGQKIAKGNPCPRAYYRCTVAPSCPVRKQVQRCAEDMSILITTYEGNHNHPLSVSATAMASTTSAAASMLLSGSSSSSHPGATASPTTNLHGLNFYLSDNSKSKQFYLPNTSLSSPSHPTITLDLTTAPSSSSSSSHNFSRFTTANYPPNPRYSSSTSLNFGSSESNNSMSWGSTGLLSYGGTTQSYIKNQIGTLNLGRPQQPMENVIYQSYMQKNNPHTTQQQQQPALADPIAAATKAITADPTFQSALAAALSSIIGGGGGGGGGSSGVNQVGGGDNFGQKLKWAEQFPLSSSYSSSQAVLKGNTNGCGSSFLNKSSTTTTNNSQPGSLIFLQPASLPFSTSKSASSSPGDKEQNH
ncbi:hypothetical protein ACOSP7_024400 [Xanthoceras sorbifolium]|uniref:WRKY domain-containing protein n=1 Tax=Xanthoceras sorbifolium TaxID=99658 RepID=A0ABQ8H8X0_9ROSI|nr:hypothetical protein JRO89_XS13G0174300 [Xanthoceras sorbifolium]